jgi:hypothetical protein
MNAMELLTAYMRLSPEEQRDFDLSYAALRQTGPTSPKSPTQYKDPEIAAFAAGFAKLEREAALGRQTISDLKASADYDLE